MPAFKKVNKKIQVTKCTPETIEKICNALRFGSYIETAVVLADVQKTTFYTWMKLSYKKPKSIYAELRVAVEKAQEEATARDLLNIDKCAMGEDVVYARGEDGEILFNDRGRPMVLKMGTAPDWNASAWRLSRRKPKEWANTEKLELTGKDGGPVKTTEATEEELKKELDENLRKLKLLE